MSDQPFHHGNLRAVLLDHAEQALRDGGVDALSLRELARQAGVSHGAPRSHFVDRRALLDALAERGFNRLADEVQGVIAADADDYEQCLLAVATVYVRFAITDAALLELMFATKNAEPPEGLRVAAERLFAAFSDLIELGIRVGKLEPGVPYRLQLLLAATLQGIASLVSSGRITSGQGDELIADAATLFLRQR